MEMMLRKKLIYNRCVIYVLCTLTELNSVTKVINLMKLEMVYCDISDEYLSRCRMKV